MTICPVSKEELGIIILISSSRKFHIREKLNVEALFSIKTNHQSHMLFRISLPIFFILLSLSGFAQNNTFNITGIVTDTLGEPLIASTILLLEKQDSTMVEFTKSELSGDFIFKNIAPGDYLVKTTYIGYIPTTVDASAHDGKNINLGNVEMAELAEELMTVVIKAAKAPIKMRGDTIEYDATTFKVPEGSTVEDLLKRLPGIEVESDGSILADGKNVNKVTVDGKSFFGSSPQAATKNLPAEGIGKVQVFDTKSEQEEITGATSEAKEKTMNLQLKEEFKKGAFGKVIASIGTEDRKEIKGNYNKFNKKMQFSLIGVGNNTGRNGLSWDDYQDFAGSNAWNFGGNTDYGFGGGRRSFSFGGSSGGIESSIRSSFFNNGASQGFPENYNAGVNFNYDHNDNKVSAVYYYNQAGVEKEGSSSRERFFQNFTTKEDEVSTGDDISNSHRVEIELSKEIDSLHFVKFLFNGAQIDENKFSQETTTLTEDDQLRSTADVSNDINTQGVLAEGLLLLRKKFKKKGRSLGLNTSILYTELDEDWSQESRTTFVNEGSSLDSISLISQTNNNIRDKVQIKANALYVEPLSKRIFWQTFYNYSDREETGDREVNDEIQNELQLNQDLSRVYENSIILNRIGSSIRYSHNGMNISLGLAYQKFDLVGDFRGAEGSSVIGTVDEDFNNWVPNFSFNFQPFDNARAGAYFSREAIEPRIEDLQPVVNNLNPQYIVEGNPALTPELSNDFSVDFSKSFPLSGTRFSFDATLKSYENQFSTNESVDEFLVTTVQPINVEGGYRFDISSGINFPIIKNKITTRLRMRVSNENRISFVNDEENTTRTTSYSPYIRFNITPIDNIGIYLTANYSFRDTRYDINESQNQTINSENYSVEFSAKTFWSLLFSANLNYERFDNDRFGVERDIPVLDISVSRPFLKKNRMEARLSLFDVFDQNVGFTSIDNFQSENRILGQYFLFSLTYNIRGVRSSAQKRSWF